MNLCFTFIARVLAFSIILVLPISGCTKSNGQEYFPEPRVGDQREYSISYKLRTDSPVESAKAIERVIGRESINGKPYWKIVMSFTSGLPGFDDDVYFLRRDENGFFAIEGAGDTQTEYLVTPPSVEPGDSWTVTSPRGVANCRADGLETVVTTDRTYEDCLKIACEGPMAGERRHRYYAPGVGDVKSVFKYPGGRVFEQVLDKL